MFMTNEPEEDDVPMRYASSGPVAVPKFGGE